MFFEDGFAAKKYKYVQPGTPGRTYTTKTIGSYAINASGQYNNGSPYYYAPVVSDPAGTGLWSDGNTVPLSKIVKPAETVFVVETLGWRANSGTDSEANAIKFINAAPGSGFNPKLKPAGSQAANNPKPSYATFGNGDGEYQEVAERHLDTSNVLWCDGHVKAVKLDKIADTHLVNGTQVNYLWTSQDD